MENAGWQCGRGARRAQILEEVHQPRHRMKLDVNHILLKRNWIRLSHLSWIPASQAVGSGP